MSKNLINQLIFFDIIFLKVMNGVKVMDTTKKEKSKTKNKINKNKKINKDMKKDEILDNVAKFKDKKKFNESKVIILLMRIIVVVLLIIIIIFASKFISYNIDKTINNSINKSIENTNDEKNSVDKTNKNNEDKCLDKVSDTAETEAKEILDKLFKNETVRHLIDNPGITYCGDTDDNKRYTNKDLGLDYEEDGLGLYKCISFNTFEELTNYFKTFFTDNFYRDKLENQSYSTTEYIFLNDGSIRYRFYEKDGSLYMAMSGKGSNVSKSNLLNVKYNIKEALLDKISANVEATWQASSDDFPWVEKIDIEVVKNNNIWKINKYDVLDD